MKWGALHKELQRAWHERNRDKVRERKRRNKDPIADYQRSKKWREKNPEAVAASIKRAIDKKAPYLPFTLSIRRVRTKGHNRLQSLKGLSVEDMNTVLSWRTDGCVYCGTTDRLCLDHIIPVCRGGEHAVSNFQWACRSHNAQKGRMTDAEYRKWCGDRGIPLLACHSTIC